MLIAFAVGFLVAGITGISILSLTLSGGTAKISNNNTASTDYNDPIIIPSDSLYDTTIVVDLKGDLIRFGQCIELTVTIRTTEDVQYWKYADWEYHSVFYQEWTVTDTERYITPGLYENSDTLHYAFPFLHMQTSGLLEKCIGIMISYIDMAGNVVGALDEDYLENTGCYFFYTLDEKLERTDNPYDVDEVPDNDVSNFVKNYPIFFTCIVIAILCLLGVLFILVRTRKFKKPSLNIQNLFRKG
jgi:hypothetical protein